MAESKIKYSCADFTFPLLSHRSALQLIQLMGIGAVDLGLFEDRSHNYPSAIIKDFNAVVETVKNHLDAADLAVSDVFLQTGADPPIHAANTPDHSVRDKNREMFLKIVEFTHAVGSEHITGLPGVYHKGHERSDDWGRAIEEAQWRIEYASKAGITYSVEPHVGSILPNATITMDFIKACPGLTLTLDYGHFIYQGQSNKSVHPLIPYASHFHARGGAKGRLQTIVRENTIDYYEIINLLLESGYEGYICLEYVYQDWEGCNRTDNVSETLLLHDLLLNYTLNAYGEEKE